jgi:hypothetical protein
MEDCTVLGCFIVMHPSNKILRTFSSCLFTSRIVKTVLEVVSEMHRFLPGYGLQP